MRKNLRRRQKDVDADDKEDGKPEKMGAREGDEVTDEKKSAAAQPPRLTVSHSVMGALSPSDAAKLEHKFNVLEEQIKSMPAAAPDDLEVLDNPFVEAEQHALHRAGKGPPPAIRERDPNSASASSVRETAPNATVSTSKPSSSGTIRSPTKPKRKRPDLFVNTNVSSLGRTGSSTVAGATDVPASRAIQEKHIHILLNMLTRGGVRLPPAGQLWFRGRPAAPAKHFGATYSMGIPGGPLMPAAAPMYGPGAMMAASAAAAAAAARATAGRKMTATGAAGATAGRKGRKAAKAGAEPLKKRTRGKKGAAAAAAAAAAMQTSMSHTSLQGPGMAMPPPSSAGDGRGMEGLFGGAAMDFAFPSPSPAGMVPMSPYTFDRFPLSAPYSGLARDLGGLIDSNGTLGSALGGGQGHFVFDHALSKKSPLPPPTDGDGAVAGFPFHFSPRPLISPLAAGSGLSPNPLASPPGIWDSQMSPIRGWG
jgi:hypothetical protein